MHRSAFEAIVRERGMPLAELARRTGISRDSLLDYMRRKSRPRVDRAQRIAAVLGRSVDELFPRDEQRELFPRDEQRTA